MMAQASGPLCESAFLCVICGSTPIERFQRIEAMKAHHPLVQRCAALGVSCGGFSAWSNQRPSRRIQEDERLTE
jgi:hypothetical protein